MDEGEANCCVCEGWFAPQDGRPCRRCPDDWICSDVCLAQHRRSAWHRENQRAWVRHVAGGGEAATDGSLWRATVALNRSLRRRLAETEARLQVALAEAHALRGRARTDHLP